MVDWQRMVLDLVGLGMTCEQIAEHCECARSTISDIRNGATGQPRFDIANALLALHRRKMRAARTRAKK